MADDSPENTDVYRVETWSRRQNVLVNHATKTIATLDANMVPSHRERFVGWGGARPSARFGRWLAALDDFRNWLIREAA